MALVGRDTLRLLGVLALPAACSVLVGVRLFPAETGLDVPWSLAVPAALAALLLAGASHAFLARPVRSALEAGDAAPGDASRRAAAARALVLPSRTALLVLTLGLGDIAAVAAVQLARGAAMDATAAAALAASAFAIMAAMASYSVTSATMARAIARLGPVDELVTGSTRVKAAAAGAGLLVFAVLLVGAAGYARYRSDLDAHEIDHARQALRQAARLVGPQGARPAVEFAARAAGLSAVVLARDGGILARAGEGEAPRLWGASTVPLEPVSGGWVLRLPLDGGQTLAAFVSEAPLVARRRAFLGRSALIVFGLAAVGALLVALMARSFAIPLRYIGRAADRVASGDLSGSPPTVSGDEVGRLAADFRRMTRGLAVLVRDVREASLGVLAGTREVEEIGVRVRSGAAGEREQVVGMEGAVEAMQESVTLAARGIAGLSEYAATTSSAIAEMTAALEEVRRQVTELEGLSDSAGQDVEQLAETGRRAQAQLGALDELAGHASATLVDVSGTLESLENSAVASQLAAAQAAELAEQAGVVVREAVEGIEGVRAVVGDAKGRVTTLGRRSDDIAQILDFINEVAGRTNLLSLNASIIATQAGEHGKAFAVVAEQVRELAAQISSSSKSIGEIVRAVREDVEGTARAIDRGDELAAGGVALARKSLGALEEIRTATARGHETAAAIQGTLSVHASSSREVADLVVSVASNSKALAEAVQMVGKSVSGVGSVTRGVRALADRVGHALQEQASLGRSQLDALERINRMLGEISGAMERHGLATGRVRESLRSLARSTQQHEAVVGALGGVARRLGSHSRSLAERVDRFKLAE